LYSALYQVWLVSKALILARVNERSHPHVNPHRDWAIPGCLYFQPQSITALWPVLISRPAEGRRLSWPGYQGGLPVWRRSPIPVLTGLDVE